ncbi:MAG: hypothetical protein ABGZ35_04845, partial [Planctomycetaceae bacterium]
EILKFNPNHVDAARRVVEIAADLGQEVGPTLTEPIINPRPIELVNAEVSSDDGLASGAGDARVEVVPNPPVSVGDGSGQVATQRVVGLREFEAGSGLEIPDNPVVAGERRVHDAPVESPLATPELQRDFTAADDAMADNIVEQPTRPQTVVRPPESENIAFDARVQSSSEFPTIVSQESSGESRQAVSQVIRSGIPENRSTPSVSQQVVRKMVGHRGQMVKFRLTTRTNVAGALPYREHQLDVVDERPGQVGFRDAFQDAAEQVSIESVSAGSQPDDHVANVRQVLAPEFQEPEQDATSRLDGLVMGLSAADASSRVMAAFELGELSVTARPALPALLDAMTAERNAMVVVLFAEAAAKVSGGDERALQILSKALNQHDPCVRGLAVLAISEVIMYIADARGRGYHQVSNDVWDRFVGDVSSGIRSAMYQDSKSVRDAARQAGFWIGIQEPAWVAP